MEINKVVQKQLESNEKIIKHTDIYKFNDYKKRQARAIIITNLSLFNLKGQSIKRKISLIRIKALTVSTSSPEFILHVPDERSNKIQKSIQVGEMKQFLVFLNKIKIFFKEEHSLINYATTKSDKKKRISRMPSDHNHQFQIMDEQGFQQIITGENESQQKPQDRFQTLYSQDKDQLYNLNSFYILKSIGKGIQGYVLLVEQKDTGEWFALKAIRKNLLKLDSDDQDGFKTIGDKISNHVNNNFINNLVYAFHNKQKIFFVSKLMRGGELSRYIKPNLSEDHAKFYISQIMLGLAFYHYKGLIYKCLTPFNILMDDYGNAVLCDYGCGRLPFKNENYIKENYYQYLAPEFLQDQQFLPASDWWSLGIILQIYQILYGVTPYYKSTEDSILGDIKNNPLKLPPEPVDLSNNVKMLISSLLRVDPKTRIGYENGFVEIFQHPWFMQFDYEQLIKRQLVSPLKNQIQNNVFEQQK